MRPPNAWIIRANAKSEIKPVQVESYEVTERGRLDAVQSIHVRSMALQDGWIDEVRLQDPGINSRGEGIIFRAVGGAH